LYFAIHDAPNGYYCERSGLQEGRQASTWTLLLQSLAVAIDKVQFGIVLLKYERPSLKKTSPGREHMLLLNHHIPISIDDASPDVQGSSFVDTNPLI